MLKPILLAVLALGGLAYVQAPAQTQTVEPVLTRDGSPTKYTLRRFGPELTIMARHQMRDGIRATTITDLDGDGKVDLAFVSGKETDDEAMFYVRRSREGVQYRAEWQEEWGESVAEIEKIIGRSIRKEKE